MKKHFFSVVVFLALSSAGSAAQDMKLTVDQAKKLLPEAAGISNADFKALMEDPREEVVKSKSLSLVLLALKPPQKNPDADKEFRVLGEELSVSEIARAMWISKDEGYASFIQPKYIIECTCESTAERAEGVVAFKSALFAGRIPFVAQATKDGWVITEFRLPQYKTKVVRGKDGVWSQETLTGKPPGKPAELKVLDRLVGTWRYEWESKPTEGEPKGSKGTGTSTNEWILDGWFQQHKGKGDNPAHEILEVWTYDQHTKTYRAWGFMAPGGNHYEATGAWDEESKTLRYKGKGPGDITTVSTMRFIDKDNRLGTRVAKDAAGKVVQDTLFKLTRQK